MNPRATVLGDRWPVLAGLGFAALLAAALAFEAYAVAAVPAVLAVIALGIWRMPVYMGLLLFAVPLSINLEQMEIGGLGLYLPTEPMLAGILVLFLFRSFSGFPVDAALMRHPLSRWITAGLLWMGLTVLMSHLPLVSLKAWLVRIWFVVGFFWVLGHLIRHRQLSHRNVVLLYAIPLAIVVIYTLIRHAGYGFDKDSGHWVMTPFYKDHTSYGAVLALFVPPVFALLVSRGQTPISRALIAILFAILLIGLVLSYTRAAWISLAGAAVLWLLMWLGLRLKTLLVLGVLLGTGLFLSKDALLIQLQRNEQDSSDDLAEHVESISNVSSDASNLERLNRWQCAWALFLERPLQGWGPGTYQFVYAPFQRSTDRTIISTNQGDGGNAHSEYLGPLAEQGIPGLVFFLGLLGFTLHLGFRLQRILPPGDDRNLALALFLGLMTYFVHGVLNNYLDTDKASAPFWGFMAMMVVWDLAYSRQTARHAAPTHPVTARIT
jgi:O-antigen ligase